MTTDEVYHLWYDRCFLLAVSKDNTLEKLIPGFIKPKLNFLSSMYFDYRREIVKVPDDITKNAHITLLEQFRSYSKRISQQRSKVLTYNSNHLYRFLNSFHTAHAIEDFYICLNGMVLHPHYLDTYTPGNNLDTEKKYTCDELFNLLWLVEEAFNQMTKNINSRYGSLYTLKFKDGHKPIGVFGYVTTQNKSGSCSRNYFLLSKKGIYTKIYPSKPVSELLT